DARGAGEGEERRALVAEQRRDRLLGVIRRQHGECPLRPVRAINDLGEAQCGERRRLGGLDDDRAARRQRGRDLVRDEVEREVERGDADDRAEREAAHKTLATGGRGVQVERQYLAAEAPGLLGGEGKYQEGAVYLGPGVPNRLARLGGDAAGELLTP